MLRSFTSQSLNRATLYPSYFSSFVSNNNIFQHPVEKKHPKDTVEGMKEEQRDGYCKEAAGDYNPSNRTSDYILPHLLNLYASRAKAQDFEIYAPNATFEDPLMRAEGSSVSQESWSTTSQRKKFLLEIKRFKISPRLAFSILLLPLFASFILCFRTLDVMVDGFQILIDNKQYYKFLGKDIHMISLIKLYTEGGKVVRHEDCWDKKPLRNRETVKVPLVGRMLEVSRRASMLLTHALMGFGKDPTM